MLLDEAVSCLRCTSDVIFTFIKCSLRNGLCGQAIVSVGVGGFILLGS